MVLAQELERLVQRRLAVMRKSVQRCCRVAIGFIQLFLIQLLRYAEVAKQVAKGANGTGPKWPARAAPRRAYATV